MTSAAPIPAPVLTIRGVQLNPPAGPKLDIELRPGESKAVVLPDDELFLLDAIISGDRLPAPGEVTLCGSNPAGDGVWSRHLSGNVARTFSPLFGRGCWLENLDIDENIMLASLMRGETPGAVRERALTLAGRFGLAALPETRRAATRTETLTLCQWIRALLVEDATLFLMIDALRNAPESAISALVKECRSRREKGAAFLWLMPKGRGKQVAMLGVSEILETEDPDPPTSAAKS